MTTRDGRALVPNSVSDDIMLRLAAWKAAVIFAFTFTLQLFQPPVCAKLSLSR